MFSELTGETPPDTKELITRTTRNAFFLDSFNLSDNNLRVEINKIIKYQPNFIYGYPSAIELFSRWLYNNGYSLNSIKKIVHLKCYFIKLG